MATKKELLPVSLLEELNSEGAGYDILRYVALPELLGNQSDTVLYFMGRNLARKFNIETMDDLSSVYEKMGWGQLELVKEKKKVLVFHLMSDAVALRLQSSFHTEFQLEAGFLAEAVQNIKNGTCECTDKIMKRTFLVEFSVFITRN